MTRKIKHEQFVCGNCHKQVDEVEVVEDLLLMRFQIDVHCHGKHEKRTVPIVTFSDKMLPFTLRFFEEPNVD